MFKYLKVRVYVHVSYRLLCTSGHILNMFVYKINRDNYKYARKADDNSRR